MYDLVIFDVDGTFYDIDNVVARNYEIQVDFIMGKTGQPRSEVVAYFERNCVFPQMTPSSKSATELFLRDGYSRTEWNAFREARFPVDAIDCSLSVNRSIVEGFNKISRCVLLSSNSFSTISKILNRLGMSVDSFDAIVCSDMYPIEGPFNKKSAMAFLLSKFNIPASGMLSIGDRYNTDVLPALELGGEGVVIAKPCALESLLDDMRSGRMRNSKVYKFFRTIKDSM